MWWNKIKCYLCQKGKPEDFISPNGDSFYACKFHSKKVQMIKEHFGGW